MGSGLRHYSWYCIRLEGASPTYLWIFLISSLSRLFCIFGREKEGTEAVQINMVPASYGPLWYKSRWIQSENTRAESLGLNHVLPKFHNLSLSKSLKFIRKRAIVLSGFSSYWWTKIYLCTKQILLCGSNLPKTYRYPILCVMSYLFILDPNVIPDSDPAPDRTLRQTLV